MILSALGGKATAGLAIALLAVSAWGLMQSSKAEDERARADAAISGKALAVERLKKAAAVARASEKELETALAENARRLAAVMASNQRDDTVRADFAARLEDREEVTRNASPDYRSCMDLPAPGGLLRLLRVDASAGPAAGSDRADGDEVPQPAARAPGAGGDS